MGFQGLEGGCTGFWRMGLNVVGVFFKFYGF